MSLCHLLHTGKSKPLSFLDDRQGYVNYRTSVAPTIDGRMDEVAWARAPWSDEFEDIVGPIVSSMPNYYEQYQ